MWGSYRNVIWLIVRGTNIQHLPIGQVSDPISRKYVSIGWAHSTCCPILKFRGRGKGQTTNWSRIFYERTSPSIISLDIIDLLVLVVGQVATVALQNVIPQTTPR